MIKVYSIDKFINFIFINVNYLFLKYNIMIERTKISKLYNKCLKINIY